MLRETLVMKLQLSGCFNFPSQWTLPPKSLFFKTPSFSYNQMSSGLYSRTPLKNPFMIHCPVWHYPKQRLTILVTLEESTNHPADESTSTNALHKVFTEGKQLDRLNLVVSEPTVDAKTPKGDLSPAAISAIEQFSRLNGLTGKKMRANFESYAPIAIQNEGRNLIEFCCFRYLARGNVDFHPFLKDAAFRRLAYTAMLAWQRPYSGDLTSDNAARENAIEEGAFVRIAASIPGVADKATAHYLFQALANGEKFLSFEVWDTYILDLCRVRTELEKYQKEVSETLKLAPRENIICVDASKWQLVQKSDKNIVWPGRLTLTDLGLYYEANWFNKHREPIRLDLTRTGLEVKKTRVAPLPMQIFDSAILITSKSPSETWALEFVDFKAEGRRDLWHAMLQEIICVYDFIHEFSPREDDQTLKYVYSSKYGTQKALTSAVLGLVRLQAVQSTLGKNVSQPEKLLQFYYLSNAASGDLVRQALAVSFWGGRMELNRNDAGGAGHPESTVGSGSHVLGTDGSFYLRKWMTSPTWHSAKSTAFWKHNKVNVRSLVLGKYHVVGYLTQIEVAVQACREQSNLADRTKATIDGALLKGIPENIDLLKELLLPVSVISAKVQKLRRWEEPSETAVFLTISLGLIFKNWLRYVFPSFLAFAALTMFSLRGLQAGGHFGEGFGKVTTREQPSSNTIQKIIALKEALVKMEHLLQDCNISLLKIRTIALSRDAQATNIVVLALVGLTVILLVVPFRALLILLLLDQFTVELSFRKPLFLKFMVRLKSWWNTIPAAPVVMLPFEKTESSAAVDEAETAANKVDIVAEALRQWISETT